MFWRTKEIELSINGRLECPICKSRNTGLTWLGTAVCLDCYPPVNGKVGEGYKPIILKEVKDDKNMA